MARPRKNAAKVQGSLLAPNEVAEIPVEEQPYPLPEGWKWERGNSLWKPQETEKPTGEFFYYIDIDAVDNKQQKVISPKKIPLSQAPSRASRKLHEGDTIFSLVRPYLRNIAYIDEDISSCIASTGFYICSPLKSVNSRFLYWLMTSDYVVLGLNKFMKGDNSPSIRKNDIENFPFPLPPIDEQQRIVDRIESLFAKLDEAKAKAEAVLEGFEIRKAGILHKAFTGELTVKWRAKNRVKRTSWENLTLGNVAKWGSGGTPSRKYPEYYTGDIAWVKTGELNNGYLYETEEHITKEAIKNSNAKIFPQGTVIIAMYGATIGQCAILEIAAATNQACACAIVNSNTDNKFLFTYLLSQKHNFINLGKGGAQPNISQTILKEYPIVLPSLPEQQEIVRILDNLLAKEQRAKEAAETVLTQIDLMKKAILARAFRGEMGTHSSARNSLRNNETM